MYFVPTASGTLPGTVTINSNGFFNPVNTHREHDRNRHFDLGDRA